MFKIIYYYPYQTTLWGRYQILISVCPDGENRDTVVGLAIVPVENKINYEWLIDGQMVNEDMKQFLQQLGLIVNTDR